MIKALLVEDERITRNGLLKHIPWKELGIDEIRSTDDAESAMEMSRDYHPDIIISDIRMRGIDGIEMCRRLKGESQECQIVFISSYAQKEYLKAAIELEAIQYIEKPIEQEELEKAIRKCVQKYSQIKDIKELKKKYETVAGEKKTDAHANSAAIKKTIAYMHQHYADKGLSINKMADEVYLSTTYLSSLFKQEMGVTINRYLTDIRIEYAKTLLLDQSLKLYQIADMVGYEDSAYFTRIFKNQTGFTPKEYREQKILT